MSEKSTPEIASAIAGAAPKLPILAHPTGSYCIDTHTPGRLPQPMEISADTLNLINAALSRRRTQSALQRYLQNRLQNTAS